MIAASLEGCCDGGSGFTLQQMGSDRAPENGLFDALYLTRPAEPARVREAGLGVGGKASAHSSIPPTAPDQAHCTADPTRAGNPRSERSGPGCKSGLSRRRRRCKISPFMSETQTQTQPAGPPCNVYRPLCQRAPGLLLLAGCCCGATIAGTLEDASFQQPLHPGPRAARYMADCPMRLRPWSCSPAFQHSFIQHSSALQECPRRRSHHDAALRHALAVNDDASLNRVRAIYHPLPALYSRLPHHHHHRRDQLSRPLLASCGMTDCGIYRRSFAAIHLSPLLHTLHTSPPRPSVQQPATTKAAAAAAAHAGSGSRQQPLLDSNR
ncbi:hypothetical protein BDV95DRAFT_179124 [Massariosphaeria phaeospora]|uniref:Uncharacterized protein n=1 Tax=Massariosphaeria phaeospora TaxID=100035 RepID=A0A7C8M9G4_9PLEO|nr:hypothetical protein BDV95DRAFT_179124 [Massariosphaeria phaeospora]